MRALRHPETDCGGLAERADVSTLVIVPPLPLEKRTEEVLLPSIRRELSWDTRHFCADGRPLEDEDAILAVMLAGKEVYCSR